MTKATDTFRTKPWCHNCAQAVANKWCQLYVNPQTILADLSKASGGRAPNGLCGALYAAIQALPQYEQQLTEAFEQRVGGTTCHNIMTTKRTPCHTCVDTADSLIEEFSNK